MTDTASFLDLQAAQSQLERCKGNDETSCGNVEGCSWYPSSNTCGVKCEKLSAAACQDPKYKCNWSESVKCHTPESLGSNEASNSGSKPSSYTAQDCEQPNGNFEVGQGGICQIKCEAIHDSKTCASQKDNKGSPRCVYANGKCINKVIAQCQQLTQSGDDLSVPVGSYSFGSTIGEKVVIGIICIAFLVLAVFTDPIRGWLVSLGGTGTETRLSVGPSTSGSETGSDVQREAAQRGTAQVVGSDVQREAAQRGTSQPEAASTLESVADSNIPETAAYGDPPEVDWPSPLEPEGSVSSEQDLIARLQKVRPDKPGGDELAEYGAGNIER